MTPPDSNRASSSRAGYFAIGLAVCAPFLVAGHSMPARAIESDILAMALGVLAMLWFCWHGFTRLKLPDLTLIPLALIAMICLQAGLGIIAIPEFAAAYAGYLAWTALMLIFSASVAAQKGGAFVISALAAGLLAAATLNAGAGWLHFLQSNHPAFDIHGLVGQRNRLATLLWLGVLSACHLQRCGILGKRSATVLALWLGITSVLTGQRMIYLLGIGFIGILFWSNSTPRDTRQSMRTAVIGILGAILALWLVGFLAQQFGGVEGASAANRVAPELLRSDARISAWRDALTIAGNHPWLGAGAGNFRRAILDAAALAPAGAATYPDLEHAHNLMFQWLAEFGIPATIAIMALGLFSILPGFRALPRATHLMPAGILALIGIHAMLEYPLWFAEFLGPTALALGASLPARRTLAISPKIPVAILSGALVMLSIAFTDYRTIVSIYHDQRDTQTDTRDLDRLLNHSIVSPYAYAVIAARMQPAAEQAAIQARICEQGLRVWPSAFMASRCIELDYLAGHTEHGRALLQTSRAAFRAPTDQAVLEKLADSLQAAPQYQRRY